MVIPEELEWRKQMAATYPGTCVPIAERCSPGALDSATAAFPAVSDPGYWIAHCEGYRVDSAGGRVGFVDRVTARPDGIVLTVRMGRLGRRVIEIPAEEITCIVPRAERVWIRTPGDPASFDGA
jgi:hypothetical protein